jgi:HK97 family phage major capsid protein
VNSGPRFDNFELSAKRAASSCIISNELIRLSNIDVERVVVNDLLDAIATAVDFSFLSGTGSGQNQPLGILGRATTGSDPVGSVTFGGTATFDKLVDFEAACDLKNVVPDGTAGYVTSVGTKTAFKKRPKVATYPHYLWENDQINGYRAVATNQLSDSNKVIFGAKWSEAVLATWGVIDLVSDRFSNAHLNAAVITTTLLLDVGFYHACAFAISADAGT